MSLTKATYSMIDGAPINVKDFGASSSASAATNNTAFQNALNALRDLPNGGTLVIPAGEYVLSALLSLSVSVEWDGRPWIIQGNGATLTWENSGLTTGNCFTVGATNFTYRESTFIHISNLRMIGPETNNCTVSGGITFPTANTDTTGLRLNGALNITLDNVFIRRFYRGIYVTDSWPISANAVYCSSNYIGIQLGTNCTLGQWTGCAADNAAYCLVMQPDAIDGGIGSQTFVGMRFENSLRGITLDQRTSTSGSTATIQNITFIAPRFEQMAYDLLRMGQAWVYLQPDQNGADRNTAYCQGVNVYNGEWPLPVGAPGTGYPVRSSANGYVRGCNLSLPIGQYANIVGVVALSQIFIQPTSLGGTDSGKTFFPQGNPIVLGDQLTFVGNQGQINWDGGQKWLVGTNTPEGAVTAPVGSLFTRTNGGANTTLYIKESGTGNTGWAAK